MSDGLLKFNYELSFTCNTLHALSGKNISIPPSRESQSTWGHDVPQKLKDEVQKVVRHIYGENLRGLKIEQYRMCWYEKLLPLIDDLVFQWSKLRFNSYVLLTPR